MNNNQKGLISISGFIRKKIIHTAQKKLLNADRKLQPQHLYLSNGRRKKFSFFIKK